MSGNPAEPTLRDLAHAVKRFCDERDWDRFHGAKDLAIGISTEAAELLERFRFLSESEVEASFSDLEKRSAIEDEMADVLFFLVRLAERYDVDLARAFTSKLAANARRYPIETSRGSNRKAERNAR